MAPGPFFNTSELCKNVIARRHYVPALQESQGSRDVEEVASLGYMPWMAANQFGC